METNQDNYKLIVSEFGDGFEAIVELMIHGRGVRFVLGVRDTEEAAYQLAHEFQEHMGSIWRE